MGGDINSLDDPTQTDLIDQRIAFIQRSTGTFLPFFIPIHDKLRMRFRWYYNWHANKYANFIHWAILILSLMSLPFLFVSSPNKSIATSNSYPYWNKDDPPVLLNVNTNINGVAATSQSLAWAVGDSGAFLYYSGDNGGGWTKQEISVQASIDKQTHYSKLGIPKVYAGTLPTDTPATPPSPTPHASISNYYGIYASGTNRLTAKIWIVGAEGAAYYSDNGGSLPWTTKIAVGSFDLHDVTVINDTTGWIVGNGGEIYKSDLATTGDSWSLQTSGTANNLNKISAVDENTLWAVGDGGTILKTTNGGADWTSQAIEGFTTDLKSVYAVDSTHAWAVGKSGKIVRTINGIDWSVVNFNTSYDLNSVIFDSNDNGWIFGANGLIFETHSNGLNWALSNQSGLLTSQNYNGASVAGSNPRNIFTVGNQSTLVRSYVPTGDIATKFVEVLPGQTFVDGIGASGTPDPIYPGISVMVMIYAVDDNNHLANLNASYIEGTGGINPYTTLYHGVGGIALNPFDTGGIKSVYFQDKYGYLRSSTLELNVEEEAPPASTLTPGPPTATPRPDDSGTGITTIPSRLTSFSFVGTDSHATAGNSAKIVVTARDQYNQIMGPYTGRITFSSSDNNASLPSSYTYQASDVGVHTFYVTLRSTGSQSIFVSDNENNVTNHMSIIVAPLTVTPVPPAEVSSTNSTISLDKKIIKPDGNDSSRVSVTLEDDIGNLIGDKRVRLKSSRSEDNIIIDTSEKGDGGTAITNNNGVAYFRVTSTKEGVSKLSAVDVTDNITLAASAKLTVQGGQSSGIAGAVAGALGNIKNNETVNQINKQVLKPVAETAAAVGVIPVLVQGIAALPQAFNYLGYLVALLMESLGIKKRSKPWGTVFDALTGQPVDLAIIRLFNAKTKQLEATRVSDSEGRFGFTVEPGKYIVSVTKPGWLFPVTKNILAYLAKGGSYYVGAPITVEKKTANLTLSIPLEPMASTLSQWGKLRLFGRDLGEWITISLARVSIPILLVGLVISGIAFYVDLNFRSGFVLVLYTSLTVLYIVQRLRRLRQLGTVLDEDDHKPIGEATINVFDSEYQTLRASTTSDRFGHFSIFVPNGDYYLTVAKAGFAFPPPHQFSPPNTKNRLYRGGIIHQRESGYLGYTVVVKGDA